MTNAALDVPATIRVNPLNVNKNNPLTRAVNGLTLVETSGIEPPTPGLQSRCSPN